MDIRHLRTLSAIASFGTFAKAAAALGITQSAVSQQIRTLETEFGIPLFDRSARPPVLSRSGQILLDAGRRIIAISDDVVGSLQGGNEVNSITIGAIRASMIGRLPQALSCLKKTYPDLCLKILCGTNDDLLHYTSTGQVDVAIISDGSSIPNNLNWRPFMREPLYAIAKKGRQYTSVDCLLQSGPFIKFCPASRLASIIDREISSLKVEIRPAIEVDTMPAAVMLAAEGHGVSVVTHDSLFKSTVFKKIIHLTFGAPPIHRYFGIVEPFDSQKKILIDCLYASLFNCAGPHGLLFTER